MVIFFESFIRDWGTSSRLYKLSASESILIVNHIFEKFLIIIFVEIEPCWYSSRSWWSDSRVAHSARMIRAYYSGLTQITWWTNWTRRGSPNKCFRVTKTKICFRKSATCQFYCWWTVFYALFALNKCSSNTFFQYKKKYNCLNWT